MHDGVGFASTLVCESMAIASTATINEHRVQLDSSITPVAVIELIRETDGRAARS